MEKKRAVSLPPEQLPDSAQRARERALEHGVARASYSSPPERLEPSLSCPSVPPNRPGALAFAVAGGELLEYLQQPVEVSPELLALAAPAGPTQVFRFTSPCEERGCPNFSGLSCALGRRVVQQLPAVVDSLPACCIRPTCRWYAEQGREICLRCPQIVTEQVNPTPQQRSVALGPRRFLPLLVQVL